MNFSEKAIIVGQGSVVFRPYFNKNVNIRVYEQKEVTVK